MGNGVGWPGAVVASGSDVASGAVVAVGSGGLGVAVASPPPQDATTNPSASRTLVANTNRDRSFNFILDSPIRYRYFNGNCESPEMLSPASTGVNLETLIGERYI